MAIINNNVQNVKFLRNGSLFGTRDLARQALETNKGLGADGTILLARYSGSSETDVKTIAGLIWSNGTNFTVTIVDVEGGSADVEKLRQEINDKLGTGITSANTATAQLETLSGTSADESGVTSVWGAKAYAKDYVDEQIGNLDGGVTAETGYYVKTVSEVDGKVSGTTEALPSVEAISVSGQAITAISESNGTVSATAGTIDAQYVNIADNGEIFTATTVEGALAELDAKISGAVETLDYEDTAEAKNFVTSVSETNGIISVERGPITSSGKTIVLSDNADGGVNFEANVDGTTIIIDENSGVMSVASSALVQYEGDDDTIQISAVSQGVRTVSSPLTIQKVTTGLSEIVKEEYHLIGASGNTIGAPVQIYKDSHIVSINYITTGEHAQNLEYVYIDASGNTQTTYVDMSELVLEAEFASGVTVTDGVAHGVVDSTSESFLTVGADGFKLAGVQDAIDTAVSGAVEALDADLSGNSTHVTVGVAEADGIITAVTVSEDNIANANDLAELSGKTVTAITSTNGSITASIDDAVGNKSYDIQTDASKIKMSGFTGSSIFSGITENDSIVKAFGDVEGVIEENERVTASALTDLDSRLDVIESGYVETVKVNNVALAETDNAVNVKIEAATSAMTGANAVVIETNDSTGAVTIGLGTVDCGVY